MDNQSRRIGNVNGNGRPEACDLEREVGYLESHPSTANLTKPNNKGRSENPKKMGVDLTKENYRYGGLGPNYNANWLSK